MAVWLWMVGSFGGKWFEQVRLALSDELRSGPVMSWDAEQAYERGMRVLGRLVSVALPMVIVPWGTCVVLRLLQTRLLFSWEVVRPDHARLSLSAGFRRMGSTVALGHLGWTVLQSVIALAICLLVGWEMCGNGLARVSWTAGEGAARGLLDLGLRPIRLLGFSLLIVGLADTVWQGVAYERRIRMTAREVREELRNSERRSNGATGAGQVTTEVHAAPGR
jgi:flagellar biosynthetic protein FlhB